MDQNPVGFDEAKKKEIYGLLADYYLKALEDGKIDVLARKSISSRILNAVDSASSLKEIIAFLDKLSQKYTFFLPAFLKLKGELEIVKEKEIINKLAKYQ